MKKLLALGLGLAAAAALVVTAMAATTVVVTPSNLQGWTSADTRPGGSVAIIADTSNGGNGALSLKTDPTTTAKAQYMHDANVPLASINELSYSTKQNSASFAQGDASYQLPVCLGGLIGTTCTGFTTFVFEPYENPLQGPVVANLWQSWDVDAGLMWSSRTYTGTGACAVAAGFGGAPFYTLAGLKTMCPAATVVGFGVNVGSNNPGWDVEADFVNFNGTKYDFEMFVVATDKDQCKDGGWQTLSRANGTPFKIQGDCVSYTNNGR